jgi:DNA-directed RNA polymerase subunit A'
LTKELNFKREDAIQVLYNLGVTDFGNLKKGKIISGKDIFSAILPNDFDFVGSTKTNEDVIIKNGKLIQGFIDKSTIGEENGTLLRAIYKVYGEQVGLDLLGKIFKLGIEVLLKIGFTTSISDTDIPESLITKNKEKIQEAENEIDNLINDYNNNSLKPLPGMSIEQTLENMILQILNNLRDKIGESVYENVSEKNSTVLMARSGGIGNFLNLAQMAALVGQQALHGSRINIGYTGRTLSVFSKGNLNADAHGFIRRGYRSGLRPHEYFFHTMTGRDSLMDTALRTPKSGYLYRRLANALQDLRIEYDGTVRDANKKIVQFVYGDDGIDVSKSEGGIINVKRIVKEVMANV